MAAECMDLDLDMVHIAVQTDQRVMIDATLHAMVRDLLEIIWQWLNIRDGEQLWLIVGCKTLRGT